MADFSCAKCGKTWKGRGPSKDGVLCDDCKNINAPKQVEDGTFNIITSMNLQYLTELRHLYLLTPTKRDQVWERIERACKNIEQGLYTIDVDEDGWRQALGG